MSDLHSLVIFIKTTNDQSVVPNLSYKVINSNTFGRYSECENEIKFIKVNREILWKLQ
jgi:hypothetical protein